MRNLFRCKAYAFLQPETGNAVEMYEVLAPDPAWLREPETLIRMPLFRFQLLDIHPGLCFSSV